MQIATSQQKISKVFKSGNSQAVRIPASFRLDTDTVKISQTEKGLLLEPIQDKPIAKGRGDLLLEVLSAFPDDFIEAVADRDMSPPQEREPL
nr:AbrB/MazE/SpoVT family DNA-binding domain-containing protein [uncultured Moraxella sp.]